MDSIVLRPLDHRTIGSPCGMYPVIRPNMLNCVADMPIIDIRCLCPLVYRTVKVRLPFLPVCIDLHHGRFGEGDVTGFAHPARNGFFAVEDVGVVEIDRPPSFAVVVRPGVEHFKGIVVEDETSYGAALRESM